jgi:hypothetical protein
MELDSEAIVGDNSMRFLEKTFIRMMTRIIEIGTAKGMPIANWKYKFGSIL